MGALIKATTIILTLVSYFFISFQSTAVAIETDSKLAPTKNSTHPNWLKPYVANYTIYRDGDKSGTASRSLKINNNLWELISYSSVKAFLFKDKRTEKSTFSWQQKFKPISYYYQIKNSLKKKLTKEQFDWDAKLVKGSRYKKNSWEFPLTEDLSDPLNHQILIREQLILLEKNKLIETAKPTKPISLTFNVSYKGQPQLRHYQVIGEETVTTKAGAFETIKLQRKRGSRKTIFWMAKRLGFIPVKIYQEKDNEEQATMMMDTFEFITKKKNQ